MGWISRDNRFYYALSRESINSSFVFDQLEQFSWQVHKPTFLVLDNARIHKTAVIRAQREVWRKRGLHLFFLPPYSPHLNIAETLWRMLKGQWLKPADYLSVDQLFYATVQHLDGVGNTNRISFAQFASN
jgi:transposase